jgi:hypothetical protein
MKKNPLLKDTDRRRAGKPLPDPLKDVALNLALEPDAEAARQDCAVALGNALKALKQALPLTEDIPKPYGKKLYQAIDSAITATRTAFDITGKVK